MRVSRDAEICKGHKDNQYECTEKAEERLRLAHKELKNTNNDLYKRRGK